MVSAYHTVGHHGGEQTLYGAEQGYGYSRLYVVAYIREVEFERRHGYGVGYIAVKRLYGDHRQIEYGHHGRHEHYGDERPGDALYQLGRIYAYEHRCDHYPERPRIKGIESGKICSPFPYERVRHIGNSEPQRILYLCGEDSQRNSRGKAYYQRLRYVLEQRTEPEKPERH